MSQPLVSVQGSFVNPNGSVPSGTISFALSAAFTAGGVYVSDSPGNAKLNAAGKLMSPSGNAFQITANDTVDADPVGTFYTVTVRIGSGPLFEFKVIVPHVTTAIDAAAVSTISSDQLTLVDLLACPAMVGQTITGANIPANTTVTAAALGVQTITLSNQATASGTASVTVGGVITFAALQEAAT